MDSVGGTDGLHILAGVNAEASSFSAIALTLGTAQKLRHQIDGALLLDSISPECRNTEKLQEWQSTLEDLTELNDTNRGTAPEALALLMRVNAAIGVLVASEKEAETLGK